MIDDNTTELLTQTLSSEVFCQSPDLNLDTDQAEKCSEFIHSFLPVAMYAIFAPENFGLKESCQYLFNLC